MDGQENKGWKEKLRDRYLLVIRNEETFQEVGAYKLNLLNLYLLLSSAFVILFIIVLTIFFFTPLRTIVPGYGVIEDQTAFKRLQRDYLALEEEMHAQETYITALRRMLTDNPENISDVMGTDSIETQFVGPVEKVKEDSILRDKIENELVLDEMRISLDDFDGEKTTSVKEVYFTPPVKGEVSARFMPENLHYGTDIMAPNNTPILAVLDGIVITSDWTLETGNTLAIQHDNNIVSFYKHNSANLKHVGESVKAGEAVAIIGNTGTLTTGPHLHFELWVNGKAVDPDDYINFR